MMSGAPGRKPRGDGSGQAGSEKDGSARPARAEAALAARRVAFWLEPEPAQAGHLQALIDRLATLQGSPSFAPHITLLTNGLRADESPAAIVGRIARQLPPLTLACRGIDTGATRFKCVFARFETVRVQPYTDALRAACRNASAFALDAHLSLLYAELPAQQRRQVAAAIPALPASIDFTTVSAIMPGVGRDHFDDVSAWQISARAALVGPARRARARAAPSP